MLFPHVYTFFLASSFPFSFRSTLLSAQFVYRLPCYFRLPIFNRVCNLIDLIFMVTQVFVLYAFVRQAERFSKKDRLIWLIFCLKEDFVCVYVCLSLCAFEYLYVRACVIACVYIYAYICVFREIHL